MRFIPGGKQDGQYANVPVKVVYRDRRDPSLRREQAEIVPVYLTQDDWEIILKEAQSGKRTIDESMLNDVYHMVREMLKAQFISFPYSYIEVYLNGPIEWSTPE